MCPVCRQDVDEGAHGQCFRLTYDKLLQVIAGQRIEIGALRERLIDCGALKRGEK